MIYKIIIIALFSLLLTACENNNISENDTSTDNNLYSRLGYNANTPDETEENQIYIFSGDRTNSNSKNTNASEEKKDYIANNIDLNSEPQKQNNNLLATYTTKILTSDPNRYHNITIVRNRLNGYVLKDGDTFSYNEVCGPYGPSDGFKEATILLSNGKHDKGYGGGVCQLSSTLYNAVKNLKIDITERHHHSVPVAYVPKNEDATVSLQSNLDFKFKNTSGKNLKFSSSSTENSLTVSVYAVD